MLTLLDRYFTHNDERGSIEGLINIGTWKEINEVVSKVGVRRGGHYHVHTTELFIILEGEIEITVRGVEESEYCGSQANVIAKKGDVFMIEPYVQHTFVPKTDARWLNFLSEPMNPDNPDIHCMYTGDK